MRSDPITSISVCIATYRRVDRLEALLADLARQQLLPNLDGSGPPARRRNRVIGRRERQFRIVDRQITALEIEQAARAAEIVQQMTIDM